MAPPPSPGLPGLVPPALLLLLLLPQPFFARRSFACILAQVFLRLCTACTTCLLLHLPPLSTLRTPKVDPTPASSFHCAPCTWSHSTSTSTSGFRSFCYTHFPSSLATHPRPSGQSPSHPHPTAHGQPRLTHIHTGTLLGTSGPGPISRHLVVLAPLPLQLHQPRSSGLHPPGGRSRILRPLDTPPRGTCPLQPSLPADLPGHWRVDGTASQLPIRTSAPLAAASS